MMKKIFNVIIKASVLCSAGAFLSCSDEIKIGTLDESLYESVTQLNGSVRDASNGKTSTIVELRKNDYSTSVEFSLPRIPNKGVDVTISVDADYLEQYNAEHGTSFEL